MSGANAIRSAWAAVYQDSPIILTGGSFANTQLGMFPLVGLAGPLLGAVQGAISNGAPYFAEFIVLPGAKLVSQSVAVYPFASQQVAANATVQEPLTLSILMRAPVNSAFGYLMKAAIFSSLKLALTQHNNAGGTYTVLTPSYPYQNGILLDMVDVTEGETKQVQVDWQFDFFFPLITTQEETAAYNSALQHIAGGGPPTAGSSPSWAAFGVPTP